MLTSSVPPIVCLLMALGVPLGPNPTVTHDDPVATSNGKELRVFEVGDLIQPLALDDTPAIGLVLPASSERPLLVVEQTRRSSYFGGDERVQPMTMDLLIEWIRSNVAMSSWDDDESVSIQPSDTKLFVIHDTAVLGEIASALENVRLSIAPRLKVRCIAWKAKGAASKPERLSLDRALDLARRAYAGELGAVVHDSSTQCRSNERVRLGVAEHVGYQPDLDTEVAQDMTIHDPKVQTLELGRVFFVQPCVDPEQRGILLTGIVRDRQLDDLTRRPLPELGAVSLETARVRQATMVFSTWLEGGGGYRQRVGELDTLVLVERSDPLPNASKRSRVMPLGFLGPQLRQIMIEERDAGVRLGSAPMERDMLQDLVRSVAAIGEREGDAMMVENSGMFVVADEERIAVANRLVRSIVRPSTRSFVVEMRTEYLAESDGRSQWRAHGDPLFVSCLNGRVGVAVRGTQQDYISESQVEIAQEAASNDPVISALFAGDEIAASVIPENDNLRVELAVTARALLEMRQTPPPAKKNNGIECPHTSESVFTRVLRLENGQNVTIGDGPRRRIDGKIRRTRISLTVREN